MSDKHPYIASQGGLTQLLQQFRKSFPSNVTAETLQKLGILPKNESYGLSILRFLKLIDEAGKKTDVAAKIFNNQDDGEFQKGLSTQIKNAYSDLFELRGDDAWSLDKNALIQFFRTADGSTEIVGQRQASTFQLLAAMSGHGTLPESKPANAKPKNQGVAVKKTASASTKKTPASNPVVSHPAHHEKNNALGMTVRLEINLPADASQSTYDNIFKSIRENLLNG